MKIESYLPLTKKQFAEIFKCYVMVFPDWEIVNGQIFARTNGPIAQLVGIEKLGYCAYRPWSAIRALPMPTVRMLHQFLDVKHMAIRLSEHSAKWKSAVAAMEQQFRPLIRKPLDLQEVKKLCEKSAKETTNDLCMLAILSAYLGESKQALLYCEQMQTVPPPTLAPCLEWEQRHKEFGHQLRHAIEAGNERQFLDTASTVL